MHPTKRTSWNIWTIGAATLAVGSVRADQRAFTTPEAAVEALLVACTAYHVHDMPDRRAEALKRAARVSEDLAKLDGDRAHRTRALYFDYIDKDTEALAEWRKMQDSTVLFLAVTLFRNGRFEEALAACEWL